MTMMTMMKMTMAMMVMVMVMVMVLMVTRMMKPSMMMNPTRRLVRAPQLIVNSLQWIHSSFHEDYEDDVVVGHTCFLSGK